jgi:hypothetical protein
VTTHICFHGIGVCADEREAAKPVLDGGGHLPAHARRPRGPIRRRTELRRRQSVRRIALPALTERGLRATFFVLAGRLDDPASLNARHARWCRGGDVHRKPRVDPAPVARAFDETRRGANCSTRAMPSRRSGTTPPRRQLLGRYDRNRVPGPRRRVPRCCTTATATGVGPEHGCVRATASPSMTPPVGQRSRHAPERGVRGRRNAAASLVKRLR